MVNGMEWITFLGVQYLSPIAAIKPGFLYPFGQQKDSLIVQMECDGFNIKLSGTLNRKSGI
jgi:hypothetical protein